MSAQDNTDLVHDIFDVVLDQFHEQASVKDGEEFTEHFVLPDTALDVIRDAMSAIDFPWEARAAVTTICMLARYLDAHGAQASADRLRQVCRQAQNPIFESVAKDIAAASLHSIGGTFAAFLGETSLPPPGMNETKPKATIPVGVGLQFHTNQSICD